MNRTSSVSQQGVSTNDPYNASLMQRQPSDPNIQPLESTTETSTVVESKPRSYTGLIIGIIVVIIIVGVIVAGFFTNWFGLGPKSTTGPPTSTCPATLYQSQTPVVCDTLGIETQSIINQTANPTCPSKATIASSPNCVTIIGPTAACPASLYKSQSTIVCNTAGTETQTIINQTANPTCASKVLITSSPNCNTNNILCPTSYYSSRANGNLAYTCSSLNDGQEVKFLTNPITNHTCPAYLNVQNSGCLLNTTCGISKYKSIPNTTITPNLTYTCDSSVIGYEMMTLINPSTDSKTCPTNTSFPTTNCATNSCSTYIIPTVGNTSVTDTTKCDKDANGNWIGTMTLPCGNPSTTVKVIVPDCLCSSSDYDVAVCDSTTKQLLSTKKSTTTKLCPPLYTQSTTCNCGNSSNFVLDTSTTNTNGCDYKTGKLNYKLATTAPTYCTTTDIKAYNTLQTANPLCNCNTATISSTNTTKLCNSSTNICVTDGYGESQYTDVSSINPCPQDCKDLNSNIHSTTNPLVPLTTCDCSTKCNLKHVCYHNPVDNSQPTDNNLVMLTLAEEKTAGLTACSNATHCNVPLSTFTANSSYITPLGNSLTKFNNCTAYGNTLTTPLAPISGNALGRVDFCPSEYLLTNSIVPSTKCSIFQHIGFNPDYKTGLTGTLTAPNDPYVCFPKTYVLNNPTGTPPLTINFNGIDLDGITIPKCNMNNIFITNPSTVSDPLTSITVTPATGIAKYSGLPISTATNKIAFYLTTVYRSDPNIYVTSNNGLNGGITPSVMPQVLEDIFTDITVPTIPQFREMIPYTTTATSKYKNQLWNFDGTTLKNVGTGRTLVLPTSTICPNTPTDSTTPFNCKGTNVCREQFGMYSTLPSGGSSIINYDAHTGWISYKGYQSTINTTNNILNVFDGYEFSTVYSGTGTGNDTTTSPFICVNNNSNDSPAQFYAILPDDPTVPFAILNP
jgi:hypothetical protein